MKIDRSKLKKSSSEVPLDCKSLIDKLVDHAVRSRKASKTLTRSVKDALLQELQQIKTWSYGKCELLHWIDVLDLCDEVLGEAASSFYVSSKWTLRCDASLVQPNDVDHLKDKKLLLWTLNFTALLIEHSFSRQLYSSMEHLTSLLASSDLDVIVAVLNLLYMFSKRSNFITRLAQPRRQELLTRLSYLANSWGGKENGFDLAQCCLPHTYPASATTLHFEFYSNSTIEYVDKSATLSNDKGVVLDFSLCKISNLSTVIHLENVDKIDLPCAEIMENIIKKFPNIPKEKQMLLFTYLRLAVSFSDYKKRLLCVQNRLQALSILIYTNQLADGVHTLLYPGLLAELVEVLKMGDGKDTPPPSNSTSSQSKHNNPTTSFVSFSNDTRSDQLNEIKACSLRTLTSIIHLDRHPNFPKLSNIIDMTGASLYHGFLPCLVRNCIIQLTKANDETTTQSATVSAITTSSFPQPLATALFSFLYHLSSYEPGCEALVSCGMLESLLSVIRWPSTHLDHITFVTRAVRVIDLITNLDMASFQTHAGLSCFISRLEMEINHCREQQPYQIHVGLPKRVRNESECSEESKMLEGEEYDNESEKSESQDHQSSDITTNKKSSPQPAHPPLDAPIPGVICLPQRAALLKSMLNFLKKAIPDPAFSESIRHMMDSSLPESLKHIISNAEFYGPSLFLLATEVVNVFVFEEPSLLSSLQDKGLTGVMLHALLVKDVPPTREVLASLPNIFSALCLNNRGLEAFVVCKPFESLFKVLLSPQYLPAMKRRRSSDPIGDTASNLGIAVDQLMRHQPTLKETATQAMIKLLERLCEMGRDPRYVCWKVSSSSTSSSSNSNSSTSSNNKINGVNVDSVTSSGSGSLESERVGVLGAARNVVVNEDVGGTSDVRESNTANETSDSEDNESDDEMVNVRETTETESSSNEHSAPLNAIDGQDEQTNDSSVVNDSEVVDPMDMSSEVVVDDQSPSNTSSTLIEQKCANITVGLKSGRQYIPLLDYINNVMKFFFAVLSNNQTDDHCLELIRQGGLQPLIAILSLPNLPLDFPTHQACQTLSSVVKSILHLTHRSQVLDQALAQFDVVLRKLEPLNAPLSSPGGSVLLRELVSAPELSTATQSCEHTPLLHHMSSVHSHIHMFVSASKSGQLGVRNISNKQWGSPTGLQVLKRLSQLYNSLAWESTVLLALCSSENGGLPSNTDFCKSDLDRLQAAAGSKSGGVGSMKNSSVATTSSYVDTSASEVGAADSPHSNSSVTTAMENLSTSDEMNTGGAVAIMDEDSIPIPSHSQSSSKPVSLGASPSKVGSSTSNTGANHPSTYQMIRPMLSVTSRLGRALAEIFALLVKLCVGSQTRNHRRGLTQQPDTPRLYALRVASSLASWLASALSWSLPPTSPTPRFRVTFYICTISFIIPMLFDDKMFPYHLMLMKFETSSGQKAFFDIFYWAMSVYCKSTQLRHTKQKQQQNMIKAESTRKLNLECDLEKENLLTPPSSSIRTRLHNDHEVLLETPEVIGEFLDSWLLLLERLVNPKTLMESPHSLPMKGSGNYKPFNPIKYMARTHRVAFDAVNLLWGNDDDCEEGGADGCDLNMMKNYGSRVSETILTVLCHILNGEKLISSEMEKEKASMATTNDSLSSSRSNKLPSPPSSELAVVAFPHRQSSNHDSRTVEPSSVVEDVNNGENGVSNNAASVSSSSNIDPEYLQLLMDMGFEREDCVTAIRSTYTIDQATEYLLITNNSNPRAGGQSRSLSSGQRNVVSLVNNDANAVDGNTDATDLVHGEQELANNDDRSTRPLLMTATGQLSTGSSSSEMNRILSTFYNTEMLNNLNAEEDGSQNGPPPSAAAATPPLTLPPSSAVDQLSVVVVPMDQRGGVGGVGGLPAATSNELMFDSGEIGGVSASVTPTTANWSTSSLVAAAIHHPPTSSSSASNLLFGSSGHGLPPPPLPSASSWSNMLLDSHLDTGIEDQIEILDSNTVTAYGELKALIDKFTAKALRGSLILLDELPDAVYKVCDLLVAMFHRNGSTFKRTLLQDVINEVGSCVSNLLLLHNESGASVVKSDVEEKSTLENKLAIRLHLFCLLFDECKVLCCEILDTNAKTVLSGLIDLLKQTASSSSNSPPKWLTSSLLCIDLHCKVVVAVQRKSTMRDMSFHTWKWLDVTNANWISFSNANNEEIDKAFWSGKPSIKLTNGRRKYKILFHQMIQINEETGNRRPVMIVPTDTSSKPKVATKNDKKRKNEEEKNKMIESMNDFQPVLFTDKKETCENEKEKDNPGVESYTELPEIKNELTPGQLDSLVETSVKLMSKCDDKDNFNAILRLLLRLTQSYERAKLFASLRGIQVLLSLEESKCGFAGFESLSALLIRHVVEDNETLHQTMERIVISLIANVNNRSLGSHSGNNSGGLHHHQGLCGKEFHYLMRFLSSAACRDPTIFSNICKQYVRVDLSLLGGSNGATSSTTGTANSLEQDKRLLVKAIKSCSSSNNSKKFKDSKTPISPSNVSDLNTTKCVVRDLLNFMASSADESKNKPLISKSFVCGLLAEFVHSYSYCARFITEHTFNPSDPNNKSMSDDLINNSGHQHGAPSQSALSFLLNTLLKLSPSLKIEDKEFCQTIKALIAALAVGGGGSGSGDSSNNLAAPTESQNVLVMETKNALYESLSQPDSHIKHMNIQCIANLVTVMIEAPSKVVTSHPANVHQPPPSVVGMNSMVRIMIKKGLPQELAMVIHWCELNSPHVFDTLNCVLKPLEMLTRIVNTPSTVSSSNGRGSGGSSTTSSTSSSGSSTSTSSRRSRHSNTGPSVGGQRNTNNSDSTAIEDANDGGAEGEQGASSAASTSTRTTSSESHTTRAVATSRRGGGEGDDMGGRVSEAGQHGEQQDEAATEYDISSSANILVSQDDDEYDDDQNGRRALLNDDLMEQTECVGEEEMEDEFDDIMDQLLERDSSSAANEVVRSTTTNPPSNSNDFDNNQNAASNRNQLSQMRRSSRLEEISDVELGGGGGRSSASHMNDSDDSNHGDSDSDDHPTTDDQDHPVVNDSIIHQSSSPNQTHEEDEDDAEDEDDEDEDEDEDDDMDDEYDHDMDEEEDDDDDEEEEEEDNARPSSPRHHSSSIANAIVALADSFNNHHHDDDEDDDPPITQAGGGVPPSSSYAQVAARNAASALTSGEVSSNHSPFSLFGGGGAIDVSSSSRSVRSAAAASAPSWGAGTSSSALSDIISGGGGGLGSGAAMTMLMNVMPSGGSASSSAGGNGRGNDGTAITIAEFPPSSRSIFTSVAPSFGVDTSSVGSVSTDNIASHPMLVRGGRQNRSESERNDRSVVGRSTGTSTVSSGRPILRFHRNGTGSGLATVNLGDSDANGAVSGTGFRGYVPMATPASASGAYSLHGNNVNNNQSQSAGRTILQNLLGTNTQNLIFHGLRRGTPLLVDFGFAILDSMENEGYPGDNTLDDMLGVGGAGTTFVSNLGRTGSTLSVTTTPSNVFGGGNVRSLAAFSSLDRWNEECLLIDGDSGHNCLAILKPDILEIIVEERDKAVQQEQKLRREKEAKEKAAKKADEKNQQAVSESNDSENLTEQGQTPDLATLNSELAEEIPPPVSAEFDEPPPSLVVESGGGMDLTTTTSTHQSLAASSTTHVVDQPTSFHVLCPNEQVHREVNVERAENTNNNRSIGGTSEQSSTGNGNSTVVNVESEVEGAMLVEEVTSSSVNVASEPEMLNNQMTDEIAPPTATSEIIAPEQLETQTANAIENAPPNVCQPAATQEGSSGSQSTSSAITSAVSEDSTNYASILGLSSDQEIPEGIDPSFLAAIPEDMRQEVIEQHRRVLQREQQVSQRQAGQGGGSSSTEGGAASEGVSSVPLDFLAALPQNLQDEILADERRRQQVANPPDPETPVDAGQFLESLPYSLRRSVLSDLEESQLSVLPADIAAEAQSMRQQHQQQLAVSNSRSANRRANALSLLRHNVSGPSSSFPRHFVSSAGAGGGGLGGSSQNRFYGVRLADSSHHNRPFNVDTWNFASDNGMGLISPSSRFKGRQLLDISGLSCLLLLLFMDESKVSIARLHRIFRFLCFHSATREWIISSLLSILERLDVKLPPPSSEQHETQQNSTVDPSWLNLTMDGALGFRNSIFLLSSSNSSLSSNTSPPSQRPSSATTNNVFIHPGASAIICKNALNLLISLSKTFPIFFLPQQYPNHTTSGGQSTSKSSGGSSKRTASSVSCTSTASKSHQQRENIWQVLIKLDSSSAQKTSTATSSAAASNATSICGVKRSAEESGLNSSNNSTSITTIISPSSMDVTASNPTTNADGLHGSSMTTTAVSFESSPIGRLMQMLASTVVQQNSALTDKLLKLLTHISFGQSNALFQRQSSSLVGSGGGRGGHHSSNLTTNNVVGGNVSSAPAPSADVNGSYNTAAAREESGDKSSNKQQTSSVKYPPVPETHLSLVVKVFTCKFCSEEGLEDVNSLLLNLSYGSDETRRVILQLLLEGGQQLGHLVKQNIMDLYNEIKKDNPSDNPPPPSSSSSNVVDKIFKDKFTHERVVLTAEEANKAAKSASSGSSIDLQLSSMNNLTNKTSNQFFFLRILKVLIQLREASLLDMKKSTLIKQIEEAKNKKEQKSAELLRELANISYSDIEAASNFSGLTFGALRDHINNRQDENDGHGGSNNDASSQQPTPAAVQPETENPSTSKSETKKPSKEDESKNCVECCLQPLSELLSLDSLWDALGMCLSCLADTSDHHAVLVLQSTVEAFFLVHSAPVKLDEKSTSSSTNNRQHKESRQEQLSHIMEHSSENEINVTPSSTDREVSSDNPNDPAHMSSSSPSTLQSNDTSKFISFAEKHKTVLNQILRQSSAHLSDGPFSVLVDHTRVLDFDVKRKYFRTELERLDEGVYREDLQIHVKRENVFEDSFRELHRRSSDEWKHRFYIVFQGEEGQDAGGLLREWYVIISREIFNPMYALFKTSAGDSVTYTIYEQSQTNPNHLDYFKFVGRVIAKAIYDNKLLECYFNRSFYKHILGKAVQYPDMESEDYAFFKGLEFLMEHTVEELGYDLTFSTEIRQLGINEVCDLVPNGRNIKVTEENKSEYARLVCQMKMTGAIRKQLAAFLEGFYDIIPKRLISIFNEQELELLLSGLPTIDIDDLKANTEYHKYTSTSMQIVWFWRALRSFNQTDKAKFMQFVTGSSKVPLQGFVALEGMNGPQKFQIHRDDRSTDRLPSAHTCFNQIDLPAYETFDKLKINLLKAIQECSEGFGFA